MYCACGCGQVTPINRRTRGDEKRGEHQKWIRGHWNNRRRRTDIAPPNPSGICQCGCGQPAPIATLTNAKIGHVAGEHVRYVRGHVGYLKRRETLTPDLWTEKDMGYVTPCWIWNAPPQSDAGYCRVWLRGESHSAHRAMYEQEIGPIPDDLMIDHLCRQTSCVRPEHLEPVTNAVNQRRGRGAKLTSHAVAFIRSSDMSTRDLAEMFGVSNGRIQDVRAGRAWK